MGLKNTAADSDGEINRLCSGNDCIRLKDRGIRLQIIAIIKECARLDLKAAEGIRNILSQCPFKEPEMKSAD